MTKSVFNGTIHKTKFCLHKISSVHKHNPTFAIVLYVCSPPGFNQDFNMSWVSPFICTPCIPVYNRHINFIVSWARLTLSGRT
jgi:hypothetical protein